MAGEANLDFAGPRSLRAETNGWEQLGRMVRSRTLVRVAAKFAAMDDELFVGLDAKDAETGMARTEHSWPVRRR